MVTELAGLAKSIERDVAADRRPGGHHRRPRRDPGRLGRRDTLRRADDANLAARCEWSEEGAGTNGMGTALASEGPIFIGGPEHWCSGFHEWDCAGVAVRDPVARAALGALDVSSPKEPLPDSVVTCCGEAQQTIESGLRERAVRSVRELATVYWEEERPARGPLAAADTGGAPAAGQRRRPGVLRRSSGRTAHRDLRSEMPQLHSALRTAVDRALSDGRWMGVADLSVPGRDGTVPVAFRPAVRDHRVVGILLGAPGHETDGELLIASEDAVVGLPTPGRLVGLQGDRMVLVSAEEIRYAEADGSYVWLDTDRGRLRLPERGIGGPRAAARRARVPPGPPPLHRESPAGEGSGSRRQRLHPAGARRAAGQPVPVARRRVAEVRRFLALP